MKYPNDFKVEYKSEELHIKSDNEVQFQKA